jgi:hypothetical protein
MLDELYNRFNLYVTKRTSADVEGSSKDRIPARFRIQSGRKWGQNNKKYCTTIKPQCQVVDAKEVTV